jgi:hypothetical protein
MAIADANYTLIRGDLESYIIYKPTGMRIYFENNDFKGTSRFQLLNSNELHSVAEISKIINDAEIFYNNGTKS